MRRFRVTLDSLLILSIAATAYSRPVRLRCELLTNPLGIDSVAPQLSWQSDNTERNWRQSAYQIVVASSAARLHDPKPDVWDSGRQSSEQSIGVVYGGPKLESRRRYYWTVRVWDSAGQPADAAEPAWWEMGLLAKDDWGAKWIHAKDADDEADHAAGIQWIWIPGEDAFKATERSAATFRLSFDLAKKPKDAQIFVISQADFEIRANTFALLARRNWHEFEQVDITERLVAGKNVVEIGTIVNGSKRGGVAALLNITRADGTVERIPTNARWEAVSSGENSKPAAIVADIRDQRLGDPWPARPAKLLRRSFPVANPVRSARIYVTALGSYRLYLNGNRVGNDILTPDWTDYRKRILYQTYDVTSMLARGENVIGAIVGDGWYGSGLGWTGQRFNFGPPPPRFLMQLEMEFANGKRQTMVTDESWKSNASPILRSEIYAGETYDARLEQPGWDKANFREAGWNGSVVAEAPAATVSSQMSPTIQITETIKPKTVSALSDGSFVFDMGQNMVGWATLKVTGAAGTKVRLRFAEILKPDGNIYRDNLRSAEATDTYILRGGAEETFEPHFTYHGFRYVEVTGYPGKPTVESLTGQVFHTANEFTGKFTSSNETVNKIWLNAMWGQRGNMLSVPTDCPQRDERLGWMGDAQVFWRTASYNMDMAAFTRKWMRDVVDAQSPEGGFSDVSPRVIDERDGAPAWGDAGVIVPWSAWRQYGDTRLIQENWEPMEKWMNYIGSVNPDFIRKNRRNNDFGDWVPAESSTPKDLIATAYWAYDADLMSQMAQAIGKDTDAKRYSELFANIRTAYQKQFVRENGEVGNGSQTSYVLTLHMKLAPEALKSKIVNNLIADIQLRGFHLSTGFLGTPYLLSVLSDNGHPDLSYWLLENTTYPSWGYMIEKGATTMWERWNGDKGDPGMNSFNHYAFGAVVEWLYRYAAGIDTAPDAPGFRKTVIRPRVDARLPKVHAEYESLYGKIVTDWTITGKSAFSLQVTIPANTSATVYLPVEFNSKVTESGKPIDIKKGPEGFVTREIGSGSYRFQVN